MATETYKGYQIEVFQIGKNEFTVCMNDGKGNCFSQDWRGTSIEGVMALAMDFVDNL